MKPVRIVGYVLLVLCVHGCAETPERVPLDVSKAVTVKDSNAVFVSAKTNVAEDFQKSHIAMATGGGLIPALIDALIDNASENRANSTVQPMRNELGGYDLADEMRKSMDPALKQVAWLNLKDSRISHDTDESQLRTLLGQGAASVLIVVSSNALFNPDFSTLSMDSTINVLPRQQNGTDQETSYDYTAPIYKDKAQFVYAAPNGGKDREANLRAWSDGGAKLVKQALSVGVSTMSSDLTSRLANASLQVK